MMALMKEIPSESMRHKLHTLGASRLVRSFDRPPFLYNSESLSRDNSFVRRRYIFQPACLKYHLCTFLDIHNPASLLALLLGLAMAVTLGVEMAAKWVPRLGNMPHKDRKRGASPLVQSFDKLLFPCNFCTSKDSSYDPHR